jgi:hypothetical protein
MKNIAVDYKKSKLRFEKLISLRNSITVLKGGPGSGNYNGPGDPRYMREGGEKTEGIMQPVKNDHSDLPEHAKKFGIPPAWTNVQVHSDLKAGLLATGKDEAGRSVYIYNQWFRQYKSEEKFARVQETIKKFPDMLTENQNDMKSKDPKQAETAACLDLIMKTGLRPGSD